MRAQRRSLAGLLTVAVLLLGTTPLLADRGGTAVGVSSRSAAPAPSHGGSHGHHGGHGGHYGGYGGYYGGWWGWPSYYGGWGWYGWGPWWGYPAYGAVVAEAGYAAGMGALDLDIAPENAEVYVDGRYVGTADDYDGFPTYLWLERGTYDIVFYLDGFETLARQYVIRAGLLTDVEDRLRPGESVRPENLAATSTERRDARVARDREREAEVAAWEAEQAAAAGEASSPPPADEGEWRDRAPKRRIVVEVEDVDAEEAEEAAEEAAEAGSPAPTHAGLSLDVSPRDASVYLDGVLVGSAGSLAGRDPLQVLPGEHVVEVVRPGHRPERQRFEVVSGERLTLEISLGKE